MPANLPVDFEERVKRPPGTTGGDYPYAIKARDLMENFVYAALDADESLVEEATGQGGHRQRRLKIPPCRVAGLLFLGVWAGSCNGSRRRIVRKNDDQAQWGQGDHEGREDFV